MQRDYITTKWHTNWKVAWKVVRRNNKTIKPCHYGNYLFICHLIRRFQRLLLINAAFLLLLSACHNNAAQNSTKNTADNSPNSTQNTPTAIITPDWSIAATLTALDVPPIATGDVKTYPQWSVVPPLPNNTLDIGARFNPNPELIYQLSGDLLIDGNFYTHAQSLYRNIAIWTYEGVQIPKNRTDHTWDDYAKATMTLAATVGKSERGRDYLTKSRAHLVQNGSAFRAANPAINTLAIAQFNTASQLKSFTKQSPFYPALTQMGLNLAQFDGEGNAWGGQDITLADLATLDAATCLVIIAPFSPMLQSELQKNALWQRLGYADAMRAQQKNRANGNLINGDTPANNLNSLTANQQPNTRPNVPCLKILPPIWAYGDVPTMVGFSDALLAAETTTASVKTMPKMAKNSATTRSLKAQAKQPMRQNDVIPSIAGFFSDFIRHNQDKNTHHSHQTTVTSLHSFYKAS